MASSAPIQLGLPGIPEPTHTHRDGILRKIEVDTGVIVQEIVCTAHHFLDDASAERWISWRTA